MIVIVVVMVMAVIMRVIMMVIVIVMVIMIMGIISMGNNSCQEKSESDQFLKSHFVNNFKDFQI